MPDIIDCLAELYESMLQRQPDLSGYRVYVHPDVAKSMGWIDGQSLTKYNLTIAIDHRIKEQDLGDNTYQSDIWVLHG